MAHIKNKSTARDRVDLGKKMEHQVHVIADFTGNLCICAITKHTKWSTQMGVRNGLIMEMIYTCNEVIFGIMCHSTITDMIILILVDFMVLTRF